MGGGGRTLAHNACGDYLDDGVSLVIFIFLFECLPIFYSSHVLFSQLGQKCYFKKNLYFKDFNFLEIVCLQEKRYVSIEGSWHLVQRTGTNLREYS